MEVTSHYASIPRHFPLYIAMNLMYGTQRNLAPPPQYSDL